MRGGNNYRCGIEHCSKTCPFYKARIAASKGKRSQIMKILSELGISPAPWKLCRDGEIVHGNGHSLTDGDGCFAYKSDVRLVVTAATLYSKAYEVAENPLVLAVPSQTISMNKTEVVAMYKDLMSAFTGADGESEVNNV